MHMNSSASISDFSDALRRLGVQAGLTALNGRVPHRYTAVFELVGTTLRNLYICDKQGQVRPDFLAEVDMDVSFCQFVLRDDGFLTDDTLHDARLDDHPSRGLVVAYHGVPLLGNDGVLRGTLCHFDMVSHGLSSEEFEYLQQAARILPAYVSLPTAKALAD